MEFKTLPSLKENRDMVDAFGGYNRNLRIQDGEFAEMQNLTSDLYPVLSQRICRGMLEGPQEPSGMVACDSLCYTDGTDIIINGYRVNIGLSTMEDDLPKKLITMGGYIVILPDKKWVNTLDLTQYGNIEAKWESYTDVTFELSMLDGSVYEQATVSDTEPENPSDMALWIDTSVTPNVLKQFSASSGIWVAIQSTYVKITATGIGQAFSLYDGVTISGVVDESLQTLNSSAVIWGKGDNYIIIVGIIPRRVVQTIADGAIRVMRTMPVLDYVTEAGNRLWGCHYGIAENGQVVNEIYASKLGDFKNWNCFMGISTDSWVASVGTDGRFTGAISLGGYPLFFKENVLHKIYISASGAHQIQDTVCRGVARGSEESMAIVNERLYYKSRTGICVYDGSLPEEISYAFGQDTYHNAVGGSIGNKYYISMLNDKEEANLFVYDTKQGMWHREDAFLAESFCECRGELYAINAVDRRIYAMLGSGTRAEDRIEWFAETGDLMLSDPDQKYINRILLRLSMAPGATLQILAEYDKFPFWERIGEVSSKRFGSISLPVIPRRCDHLRLRFEGTGVCQIYSLCKYTIQGSDRP